MLVAQRAVTVACITLLSAACASPAPSNTIPTVDATPPSASAAPTSSARSPALDPPPRAFESIRPGNGASSSLAVRGGEVFLFDMILDETPELGMDVETSRFDPSRSTTKPFGRFHITDPTFLWEEPIRIDAIGLYLRDPRGLRRITFAGVERIYPIADLTDAALDGPVAWIRTVDPGPRAADGRLRIHRLTLATGALEEVASASPGSRAGFHNLSVSDTAVHTVTGSPRTLLRFEKSGGAPKVIPLPPSSTGPRPEVDPTGTIDFEARVQLAFKGASILALLTVAEGTQVLRFDPPYDRASILHEDKRRAGGTLAQDASYLYYELALPTERSVVVRTAIETGVTEDFPTTFAGATVAVDGPWLYAREGASGRLYRTRLR